MSESHAPSTTAALPRPTRSEWTGGRIAALVGGVLLALLSLALLSGGGLGVWGAFQRDAGYVTTDVHDFSASGSALATEKIHLGAAGVGWLYTPSLLGKVRIRVTPASAGPPLFVGIGPARDVDRYLSGTAHTIITDYWGGGTEDVAGGSIESAPGEQNFWVASTIGRGPLSLLWDPAGGSWSVVVMNAQGQPGIDVRADLGARVSALPWITIGLFVAGALLLAGGVLLIVRAIRPRTAAAAAP